MKTKNKITILCLAFVMTIGMVFAGNTTAVSAASDPSQAPVDWAFEASSVELNDAIVAKYPNLDDGNGFVTISSANAMTGDLDLENLNLSGTINGIGNFTSINRVILTRNNFTGNIPSEIGNLNATYLHFGQNLFTGSIPAEVGNNTILQRFYAQDNNLSGDIPAEFGNISSLRVLHLANNQLTGIIPISLSQTNLSLLVLRENNLTGSIPKELVIPPTIETIDLGDNNLSGEIPNEVYASTIISLKVANNQNLVGNPAIGFATSTTLNYLDIRGTKLIQASPEIPTLGYTVGTFLYDELASDLLTSDKTNLNGDITQADIDKAQESADFIADTTVKQQWQDVIDLAQKMVDAKNEVDGLLTAPDFADLKDGVDQAKVNDAQEAVNTLPAGDLKDELQTKIDTANKLLDAKKKTEGLVNPDGSLGTGVNQGKINEAQEAVNKLPNGTTKTELQKIIDLAQQLFDQKNITNETLTKPSISGGRTTSKNEVGTNDSSNLAMLYTMLGISLIGLLAVINRRKDKKSN